MHGRTWIYDIADDQNGKLEKNGVRIQDLVES